MGTGVRLSNGLSLVRAREAGHRSVVVPGRCRAGTQSRVQYRDPRRTADADATGQAAPGRLGVQVGDALQCRLAGQAGKHSASLTEALTSSRTRIG